MSKKILEHPMLMQANDLAQICQPLKHLGISYFAHVRITDDGHFTGINNHPAFAKHYLENEYYNADIHLAVRENLGEYIVWDNITRVGKSDKMYREGIQYGLQHVFTIVDKNSTESNFYHFASNTPHNSINQSYLSNLDMLKLFISYFKENVTHSRKLNSAYDIKFGIDTEQAKFEILDEDDIKNIKPSRSAFIQCLKANSVNKLNGQFQLTKREIDCLKLLVKGKTAKEISEILGLTKRTVEFYLANIRSKLHVTSKSKLIERVIDIVS